MSRYRLEPSLLTTYRGIAAAQRAPRLGEYTDEILLELLRLPSHEVGALHDAGVVAGPHD